MRKPLLTALLLFCSVTSFGARLDTGRIEAITGLRGKLNAMEGVFKVTQPRTDVKVKVDGWMMPPFMGLTSWAAFSSGRNGSFVVMGDLVLFQDEVNPVMSALFAQGIGVTALHNHFFFDEPRVFFMHIMGTGSLERLARGVRAAFDTERAIRKASPAPATEFAGGRIPEKSSISTKPLELLFGQSGLGKDGMFKVAFGRKAKLAGCGCAVGKAMGLSTWAAFAGTDEHAVVDGDFAVTGGELQPVLRSLRTNGINIVAIHNHMTGERPRIIFFHYWGRGEAVKLARAVQAARALTRE